MAGIQPLGGSKQKPTPTLAHRQCQPKGDVAPLKDRPRRGVINAAHLGVEFGLHLGAVGAGPGGDRGGAEFGARLRHCGGDAARGGGAAQATGSPAKLPAEGRRKPRPRRAGT